MTSEELIKEFQSFKNELKKELLKLQESNKEEIQDKIQQSFDVGFNTAGKLIIDLLQKEFAAPTFKVVENRILEVFCQCPEHKNERKKGGN